MDKREVTRRSNGTGSSVARATRAGIRGAGRHRRAAAPADVKPPAAPRPPDPSFLRDSYAATSLAETMDRSLHATIAHYSAGLSPMAQMAAWWDWAAHLAFSPGKRMQLAEKGVKKGLRLATYAWRRALQVEGTEPCIEPLPQDRRFADPAWRTAPFDLYWQSFLLAQQWWHNATTGVRGVTAQHERMVSFGARQFLDIVAPANFVLTNPQVLQRTLAEVGMNFVRGAGNAIEDLDRALGGRRPVGADAFEVGRNVAITPGKVVLRNRLIELLQYAPTTSRVRPEPVLIVPAWIEKYYILDLSPANSLVDYLRREGYTVFMISWRNPGPEDRDITFDDYRVHGPLAALAAVNAICPGAKVHMAGYCIGGTLLAITAAAMARDGDDRLATTTFFAAQTDFTEAGELMLFIDESQLAFLDDVMWEQGFLGSRQMAGAFQLLRSNDLVWSRVMHEYLMGERRPLTDLMAWNTNATRMPYRMHSEYLHKLFLANDLAEGRFTAGGARVALKDLRLPLFAVGTELDHVAPWNSVYKFHLLTDAEVTFVLTSGGHNAGIVAEPGHPGRRYRCATKGRAATYVDPQAWVDAATLHTGSWWPEWTRWLDAHSSAPVEPPAMGSTAYPALGDAPGTYVLQA
ncbi:MAG: alpha/beta fold hydrolase [Burkholderiales bacterium]